MEVEDLFQVFINMFVLSNALLLSLLFLIVKSKNKKANVFLGIFLLSIAFQIFNDFIGELPIEEEFGISMFIIDPFLFALPILFFYLLTTINKRIENWHYLLFIPGIIHNLLLHFGGFLLSENWLSIYEPIFYFSEILLIVYAFRILQVHKKNISDFYSELEHKSLTWLKSIFMLVILMHLFNIVTVFFDLSNVEILELVVENVSFGLLVFIIIWIAYNGLSQPQIFLQPLFHKPKNVTKNGMPNLASRQKRTIEKNIQSANEELQTTGIEDSNRSESDIQQFNIIRSQIQQQGLFTNPILNLRTLALELDLKEKELSRLINECGKVNFYQFINEYRIEKFKQLVQSSKFQQFSILGLASEAGFSSKSTFYAAFKKFEGMSPKQYENSIKKSG
jgi:AraC-like DNA-binding protein